MRRTDHLPNKLPCGTMSATSARSITSNLPMDVLAMIWFGVTVVWNRPIVQVSQNKSAANGTKTAAIAI